jgi:hypothetical protein
MLRFEHKNPKLVIVLLDGKVVGEIRKDEDGHRYYPKGRKVGGESFATLTACKLSLEDNDEDGA